MVSARAGGFDVALIPHTLAITTLGERRPGDRVNLEADVLGKYVRRYLERNPQLPLSLRQVDPLIRQLTLYRDFIQNKTKESQT